MAKAFTDQQLVQLGRIVADNIAAMQDLELADDFVATEAGARFELDGEMFVITVSRDWPDAPLLANQIVTEADCTH